RPLTSTTRPSTAVAACALGQSAAADAPAMARRPRRTSTEGPIALFLRFRGGGSECPQAARAAPTTTLVLPATRNRIAVLYGMESRAAAKLPSEPRPNADEKLQAPRVVSRRASEVGRRAGLSLPSETYVGRELSFDPVAQPQAALDGAESRADPELRNALRGEVELHARLQHEALSDSQIVLGLESPGDVAVVGHERRRVDVEHVREQPLHAEHGVRSEEHTSESSHGKISYGVFCLK